MTATAYFDFAAILMLQKGIKHKFSKEIESKLLDRAKDIVKEFYLEEYNDTYTDVSETINNALRKNNLPDFVIDRNNPIKSLKDFAKTISEDSELESNRKNGIEAVIARQLSQFSVFQDTGIFDE